MPSSAVATAIVYVAKIGLPRLLLYGGEGTGSFEAVVRIARRAALTDRRFAGTDLPLDPRMRE